RWRRCIAVDDSAPVQARKATRVRRRGGREPRLRGARLIPWDAVATGASPPVGCGAWRRATALAWLRGASVALALAAVLAAAGCQRSDKAAEAPKPVPAAAPTFVGS